MTKQSMEYPLKGYLWLLGWRKPENSTFTCQFCPPGQSQNIIIDEFRQNTSENLCRIHKIGSIQLGKRFIQRFLKGHLKIPSNALDTRLIKFLVELVRFTKTGTASMKIMLKQHFLECNLPKPYTFLKAHAKLYQNQ